MAIIARLEVKLGKGKSQLRVWRRGARGRLYLAESIQGDVDKARDLLPKDVFLARLAEGEGFARVLP